MPGLPKNCLTVIEDHTLIEHLETIISSYLSSGGANFDDCTVSLTLSGRLYKKASEFSLYFYGDKSGSYPLWTEKYPEGIKSSPPEIEELNIFSSEAILSRNAHIQYRKAGVHKDCDYWCEIPVIDCIEGWVRINSNNKVFFKMGCS